MPKASAGRRRAGGLRARRVRAPVVVDKVAGVEARGFILAAPVALALGRRLRAGPQGRASCPGDLHRAAYSLEYGEATLEVQHDALRRR